MALDKRWVATFILIFAFVILGLSIGLIGPAIPDWAYITQSNIDKFASLFIGRAIGTVTGVLVAGKIVDKFDNMVLLGFAITLCGAILFNMGIVEKLWVLATLITLVGFSSGLLNTSGNVFLLHLWKKKGESAKSNSVLQAVHAGFAVGGVLCAPLARPFLGDYKVGDLDLSDLLKSKNKTDISEWTMVSQGNLPGLFHTVGVGVMVTAILFFAEFFFSKRPLKKNSKKANDEKEDEKEPLTEEEIKRESKYTTKIAVLMFIYFVFSVGSERVYEQFIYTYTQQELSPLLSQNTTNKFVQMLQARENPSRDMASLATLAYWVGFCLFRFVAIVQAQFMSAKSMLTLNLFGCIFGSGLLLFSRDITSSILSVFIFGSSLANSFPTALSYAQTLVDVSGALASKFVFASATGMMVLPTICGAAFDRFHRIVPLVVMSCACFNAIIIVVIIRLKK